MTLMRSIKNLNLVIQAILKAQKQAPYSSTVELLADPENKLNTISRLELSKIMTDLQNKEYVIGLTASSSEALDKKSVFSIKPYADLENWYAAYLLRIKRKLQNLPTKMVKRLLYLSEEISEEFRVRNSPKLWIETDENYDDCLRFLYDQAILIDYTNTDIDDPDVRPGFTISADLDVKKFMKFHSQLKKFFTSSKESTTTTRFSTPKVGLPQGTNWEDITMKFLDGHTIEIKAKHHKYIADYKEMGFNDKRNRKPNKQWALLECLAEQKGRISWRDSSDAHRSIKKKKQRLSKALQKYFNISQDPFFPYKSERAYTLRIQFA